MSFSICLLGTGNISVKHIKVLRRLDPSIRLAVASRDLARAKKFQIQHRLQTSFGSYADALTSDFAMFVLAVPPKYHAEWVEKALLAQKIVFIEKPIFNSFQELKALWPLLVANRQSVFIGENQHFDPFHQKLKSFLRQNDLGRPVFLDLFRLGGNKSRGWRGDPEQMPHGALHEGGVHWIRRLLDLTSIYEPDPLDQILNLRAYQPVFRMAENPGEDTVAVTARHRSGVTSRLIHSWAIPRRGIFDFSKIILEKGAVYFEGRGIIGFSFGKKKRLFTPAFRDFGGFVGMWRHYLDCFQQRIPPELSLEALYSDFAYLDAAYRSLQSGGDEVPERVPVVSG